MTPVPFYEEPGIQIYHSRCEDVLPHLGRFDLLLADPPYGIDAANPNSIATGCKGIAAPIDYGDAGTWDQDACSPEMLDLIRSRADRQIIWGGNHYVGLPVSKCWLVWDKMRGEGTQFADCELAWTNLPGPIRIIHYLWNGFSQANMKEKDVKIHPTQKPCTLMEWCLGMVPEAKTILDPMMGGGTTLVAARNRGRTAVGIEMNKTFCERAVERLSQRPLLHY